MDDKDTATRPIEKIRVGAVEAAVWANSSEDGQVRFAVVFSRSYKVEGEWRNTRSFGFRELPQLEKAVSLAFDFLSRRESEADG